MAWNVDRKMFCLLRYSVGMECPSLYNPADYFLCQLNAGPKETGVICGKFGESEQGKALASEMEDIRKAAIKNKFIYGVRKHSEFLELLETIDYLTMISRCIQTVMYKGTINCIAQNQYVN